ncbi:MAG: exosortase/archaeosortase family protein [Myxococcota bacterium]
MSELHLTPIRDSMPKGRRLLGDLALAILAGVVVALSPLAPKQWLGSLAAGVLTGGAVLVWRLRRPAVGPTDPARPHVRIAPGLIAVAVLWLAVFSSTWLFLYGQWTGSIWSNEHGIFVPFVVAFLAYRTLRAEPEPARAATSPWGLPLVAVGVALAVLDVSIRTGYVGTVGLLLTLPGLSLALLGLERTRRLVAPLAASWLMLPIPRTLATDMQLRHITSVSVEWLLDLVGYTVMREATVLQLPPRIFVVSDACSGFSTLYAALSIAFLLACITPNNLRRVLLLLAAPLLAMVANVVRVWILVVLTYHHGDWFIDSFFHPASGVATFLFVLGTLLAVAGRPEPASAAASSTEREHEP